MAIASWSRAPSFPNQRESLPVPDHEDVVRIPKAVFDDLLSQYRTNEARL